jgi:hypothetical protein
MCDDTVVLVLCDKQYSRPTSRTELGVECGAARLDDGSKLRCLLETIAVMAPRGSTSLTGRSGLLRFTTTLSVAPFTAQRRPHKISLFLRCFRYCWCHI